LTADASRLTFVRSGSEPVGTSRARGHDVDDRRLWRHRFERIGAPRLARGGVASRRVVDDCDEYDAAEAIDLGPSGHHGDHRPDDVE
jgi:hypothetical protein